MSFNQQIMEAHLIEKGRDWSQGARVECFYPALLLKSSCDNKENMKQKHKLHLQRNQETPVTPNHSTQVQTADGGVVNDLTEPGKANPSACCSVVGRGGGATRQRNANRLALQKPREALK